jgi:RNA polymerase sigma factor (sigma-70 family)
MGGTFLCRRLQKSVCAATDRDSNQIDGPGEMCMSATRLDSVLHYVRGVFGAEAEHGSDADLLARFVRNHDDSAFELLMWRHAAMVLRVCQAVLRDTHAAEDAFQATFLALARKAGSISRREALAAWLYQVAYRMALKARLDAIERRALEGRHRDRLPRVAAAVPRDDVAERDLLPLVHEELNRLSAKYRSPLVLCYLEGKTHAEAAAQLGWAKGTVSGRLARAREMLKKRLVRRGVLLPAALLSVAFAASKASAVPSGLMASTFQAAVAYATGGAAAAGVSAPVLYLTQGVLQAMFFTKIKCTTAAVIACLMIFVGAGALVRLALCEVQAQAPAATDARYYSQQRQPFFPPPADDSAGAAGPFAGAPGPSAGGPAGVVTPTKENPAERKRRNESINNLKQIALAFHNYHAQNGAFPTDIMDDSGRPLLSWRVAILPFLDQHKLYTQFKLDEPWNSPNNRKLLSKMPAVYHIETDDGDSNTMTYYQGFIGKGTLFEPDRSMVKITDVTDGTSNTILLVEAGALVRWSAPQDLTYSAKKPIPALGAPFGDVLHAAFADGAVHSLRADFDESEMRKAIIRNDGENVDMDKLEMPAKKVQPGRPALPGSPTPPGFPGMPPGPGNFGPKMPPVGMPGGAPGAFGPGLPPGMPGGGPAPGMGAFPPGAGSGGGSAMSVGQPAPLDLKRLKDENAKLELNLQQIADEMQLLRNQMDKLREDFAVKQQAQKEVQKLLADREKLKQALEDANDELKAMKEELQRLKRALDKP